MSRGWVHTVYKDGIWINEIEGEGQTSSHRTKEEAVAAGREVARARQTEHVIHRIGGEIDERNSYGNDPFPPRG